MRQMRPISPYGCHNMSRSIVMVNPRRRWCSMHRYPQIGELFRGVPWCSRVKICRSKLLCPVGYLVGYLVVAHRSAPQLRRLCENMRYITFIGSCRCACGIASAAGVSDRPINWGWHLSQKAGITRVVRQSGDPIFSSQPAPFNHFTINPKDGTWPISYLWWDELWMYSLWEGFCF